MQKYNRNEGGDQSYLLLFMFSSILEKTEMIPDPRYSEKIIVAAICIAAAIIVLWIGAP